MQVNELNQLVDHWLWLSMAQSNWCQVLTRVQSAPIVWVGDHNHGLQIYAFGNLCTSIYQCNSPIWGENNVGLMSLIIFFHKDVPLLGGTIRQYQLPLIWATQFLIWVKWDLFIIDDVINFRGKPDSVLCKIFMILHSNSVYDVAHLPMSMVLR